MPSPMTSNNRSARLLKVNNIATPHRHATQRKTTPRMGTSFSEGPPCHVPHINVHVLIRRVICKYISNKEIQDQLLELIATIQVCAPIFDVDTMWDNYGLQGVFVEIFILELSNCYTLNENYCANPLALMNKYRGSGDQTNSSSYRKASSHLCLFLTQLLGAYLSFIVCRIFWASRIIDAYGQLYDQGSICTSDLTVSVLMGCFYEALATFSCHFVELESGRVGSRLAPIVNSLMSALTCVLGIHLTGMYCNPISASACTFNCEDLDSKSHVFVYWMGPLIGWILAEKVCAKIEIKNEEN
uniref:Aquaporin n=1 Tax=Romanomermis culicivorax TaxID=13658 RepID=A0A915HM62_ROMCU